MIRYTKEYLSNLVRKNIRKYRKEKKLTLQELADKVNMSHGYMRDLECFKLNKTPSLETIGLIANALQIDIKDLFIE
ncbi:MAG: helix-turn-helix transcriptional regulator [Bacilli bacterium]|nr:helix-turn-helix transcriptional regulator [Bacteroidales bacterium]MDD4188116.1 helix-turn-helix transcriptional regulator [Bacilli bacterium]